jgi:hypothetical protein
VKPKDLTFSTVSEEHSLLVTFLQRLLIAFKVISPAGSQAAISPTKLISFLYFMLWAVLNYPGIAELLIFGPDNANSS